MKKIPYLLLITTLFVCSSCDTALAVLQGMSDAINGYPTPTYYSTTENGTTSSYTGTNNSSSTSSSRRTCSFCSGKGETIQHKNTSTFGLSGPRVQCSKCNNSWSYGTVHAHHTCSHCHGKGYTGN